jgi:hypothetical protein
MGKKGKGELGRPNSIACSASNDTLSSYINLRQSGARNNLINYKEERPLMAASQGDLAVITKAKDLCSYIMTVTDKSPKRFRFSLVAKLQGYALNTIENLYRANEVFVKADDTETVAKRKDYQHQALTELKLLGYIAQLAMEQGCILAKQYEQITKKIHDCQQMLGAWLNSDRRRFGI